MSIVAAFKKQWNGFLLDIAFRTDEGVTVLFGSSGAGKTTTLRLIAGLVVPDEGHLSLNGTTLFDSARMVNVAARHRCLGYVFQQHALFPHMDVLQNIVFGAKGAPPRMQRESAHALIATLRLEGLEHKYPHEISAGQQQRVAFARAIIRKPRALLLDEPFSSLDTITRVKMRSCLKNVMKDLCIPVILITHDIFEACHMADNMLIYSAGKIVQEGDPAQILKNPATEEVAALTSFSYYQDASLDEWP